MSGGVAYVYDEDGQALQSVATRPCVSLDKSAHRLWPEQELGGNKAVWHNGVADEVAAEAS